ELDRLDWSHLRPFVAAEASPPAPSAAPAAAAPAAPQPALNEWQRRLRALAAKVLAKGTGLDPAAAQAATATLFEQALPHAWAAFEAARTLRPGEPPIPLPVWEDLWR